MRAVVQKCNWCRVDSEGEETASIQKGYMVLLGVKKGDTEKDADYIADKILHMRVFEDENDKLNLSLRCERRTCFSLSIHFVWRCQEGAPPQLYGSRTSRKSQ